MINRALIAWIVGVLISVPGCAPNRNQWMSQAATQQAALATESIGDVQRVKAEAREGAAMLNGLSAAAQNKPPAGNQQVASAFASDATEVSSGLQAIAESQTDAGFTNAVFAMCDPARKAASPRVLLPRRYKPNDLRSRACTSFRSDRIFSRTVLSVGRGAWPFMESAHSPSDRG
jgi:hypothetical protein